MGDPQGGEDLGGEVRLFCMDTPTAEYFLFKHDLDQEFRSNGLANLLASVLGGFGGSLSILLLTSSSMVSATVNQPGATADTLLELVNWGERRAPLWMS